MKENNSSVTVSDESTIPTNSLHVSNLPFDTTEEDLHLLFKDYGVTSIQLLK
jgi:RNA recognition motif-containing protein